MLWFDLVSNCTKIVKINPKYQIFKFSVLCLATIDLCQVKKEDIRT